MGGLRFACHARHVTVTVIAVSSLTLTVASNIVRNRALEKLQKPIVEISVASLCQSPQILCSYHKRLQISGMRKQRSIQAKSIFGTD